MELTYWEIPHRAWTGFWGRGHFHEYISTTADIRDGAMKLFLLEDPDDKSMSIMVTQGGESCLIFSGENIEHFDIPAYIPKEGDEET